MNVLIVSQCSKRALTQTRRILDQFAERRGERTWQTAITQQGLDTLRRLLRKSARRNTAVACHWIRGRDHSELLWVVGDRHQFNAQGAVPTNETARDVLRSQDENSWRTGVDIELLTTLASLLHDLGKASRAFQLRLEGKLEEVNQYRHEWVSLRLFEAFVGTDDDPTWLKRLSTPSPADDASWLGRLKCDGVDPTPPAPPFANLKHAPLAQAIGWLVVTHHRLPTFPVKKGEVGFQGRDLINVVERIDARWNEDRASHNADTLRLYWDITELPISTPLWRERTAEVAHKLAQLISQPEKGAWMNNPFVMHLARLSLMLADHYYSSLGPGARGRVKVDSTSTLFANTVKKTKQKNQKLDEHLIGVAQHSMHVTRSLPRFAEHLPHLGEHKRLKKRSTDERFRWQDKAAEVAGGLRERSQKQGAFIVNMASTGAGKTLANARVMHALADEKRGMRCAFAMGLRTLTLQTGRVFQSELNLGADQLAIRVGGSASRVLFEYQERLAEETGSASSQALLDETSHVIYEGNHDTHPLLKRVMHDPRVHGLLAAPILVCTIDHLVPATESTRGGHQIAPMLRLMSGDLVLDELDDFDIDDLPALTRLMLWAGMLGTRVLISSATLPPSIVQGMFEAYRNGREHFNRNCVESNAVVPVCCAWIDEFNQRDVDCASSEQFVDAHSAFVDDRVVQLKRAPVRRRMAVLPTPAVNVHREKLPAWFAEIFLAAAYQLHVQHHSVDPHTKKRVSFGLIRMANIDRLFNVALAMYRAEVPAGTRIHLCVYHSQFPQLLRSHIEFQLDQTLNRRWHDRAQPEPVFQLPDIRKRLEAHPENNHIFIVLGSPVTEVGRDHDYDWAIVEPSSMRSLIQLAGRVKRHRNEVCAHPNILVLNENYRHVLQGRDDGKPAFVYPGFETDHSILQTHAIEDVLRKQERDEIDARPRIVEQPTLQHQRFLVDLEHHRLRDQMLKPLYQGEKKMGGRTLRFAKAADEIVKLNAAVWWSASPRDALMTGVLPKLQCFRKELFETVEVFFKPTDDGDNYELVELRTNSNSRGSDLEVTVDQSKHHRILDSEVTNARISYWCESDYLTALRRVAEDLDMSLGDCARRLGLVTLIERNEGWRFHPALGFSKK